MPDPEKYTDKQEFMSDCMHQMRKVEKRPQDQSVAICLSMWRRKEEKKKKKKSSVGEKIKKIAYMIKKAIPHFSSIDLFFEKLVPEDIPKVIKDILKGETIRVPVDLHSNFYTSFSLKELNEVDRKIAIQYFEMLLSSRHYKDILERYRKGKNERIFFYDEKNKIYRKKVKEELEKEKEEEEEKEEEKKVEVPSFE